MEYQEFDNAFDAVEPDPAKAAILKLQSSLIHKLQAYITQNGLSQTMAAKKLGTTQPRISEIKNGKISVLGLNALVEMATRAGIEVVFHFEDKKAA